MQAESCAQHVNARSPAVAPSGALGVGLTSPAGIGCRLPGGRPLRSPHGLPSSVEESEIMAMPTRETAVTTIEELLALPDDGLRHELLDGVHVVTRRRDTPTKRCSGSFASPSARRLKDKTSCSC